MRSSTLTLLLACLSGPALCVGSERPFIDEPEPPVPSSVEDRDMSWKEGATALPPWPQNADLVEFSVDDPSSQFRQYIDGKHIRIGTDGAVRYTLVVESRSGVRNVSFEGMRCTPKGSYKIYAFGNDGRFEKSESAWMPIETHDDKLRRDLHELMLCVPRKFKPRPTKDIVRTMQIQVPHEKETGFLPD